MELEENTYKEKILFHNDQRINNFCLKALGYAVQGTIIISLLYLVSNINSSGAPFIS